MVRNGPGFPFFPLTFDLIQPGGSERTSSPFFSLINNQFFSAAAAPIICAAKAGGTKLTVETCPHYLTIAAEEIPDGATQYKCAPPIRETANQERLWKALGDGTIDFVASDHSPAPPQTKCTDTGDYMRAWGGIASLQLTLPLLWTRAHKRGFGIEDIARWLCRIIRRENLLLSTACVWPRSTTW